MGMRVGMGIDAHRFAAGVPLMLGTLAIDHPDGLAGHSDGDAVAHAICDALLAASGGPDIGVLFPSGAADWEGVTGRVMIEHVMARLRAEGAQVVNVHVVIMCETPRVAPLRMQMQSALSELMDAPVSVHATTTDGMGFTGREEGIACHAVALVELPA
ncbi:MAG: 2-C-methyl-D-erythritol 2,4-cyclodiphosphate synthase [Thermoleophilia bacterium]|nr:2-C-methyl-D-erythritol 2,4-cyclodiphosphate synthase [Thermoleophilia bacterium]